MNHPIGITTKSPWSLAKAKEVAQELYGESIIKQEHDAKSNVLLVWISDAYLFQK